MKDALAHLPAGDRHRIDQDPRLDVRRERRVRRLAPVFFDQHSELADLRRRNGRVFKADLLTARGKHIYLAAPGDDDDDPQDAATMAMPVSQPPQMTNAVSTT
jgi:hypothetical protein